MKKETIKTKLCLGFCLDFLHTTANFNEQGITKDPHILKLKEPFSNPLPIQKNPFTFY